jgi:hypothetical protein
MSTDSIPVTSGPLDPRISLATAMHAQPGAYALLLGSGASTGAGMPTGWGVVQTLVAQAIAASGEQVTPDLDPEAWWLNHGDGEPLGYSSLLASLASTPAARRALLAGFFEPSDDEREQGVKVPGAGHKAIAALVRRGAIRVIVTTNFDRLIEQALEAEGIFPQVVATPSAIEGMEPLAHARCTVIKLHGDYARIDQLNTVEELSQYTEATQALLDRVLDEYGLVINGWSGDWDHALVSAIEGTRSRRYPLYWATYGALGEPATRLVAQHRAHVIGGASTDQFFPDLVGRLDALDALADPPLSRAMAIARVKRLLPDPIKHIELRDLFEAEIVRIRSYLATRSQVAPATDGQTVQDAHEEIRARCDTLLHLLASGVYLDRDRQHTPLWVWVIEQLMRARRHPDGMFYQFWVNLDHYPALLALKVASLGAVAVRHDDVLLRVLRDPTWRDRTSNQSDVTALDALHEYRVLDHDVINTFPRWEGTKWLYPRSRLLKDELRSVLLPLVGDEESYVELYSQTEYRVALAQSLFSGRSGFRAAPGEFIGDWQWDSDDILVWETDFRGHADRDVWGWEQIPDGAKDVFSDKLSQLSAALKSGRRWG